MLKLIICWFGMVSASSRIFLEESQFSNASKDYNVLLWKESALNILCNFNASAIYFYFERKTSWRLATGLLKGVNDCGTATITLKNKLDYKVDIINDDGILMYMVLVIANAQHSINLSHVKKQSGDKSRSYFIVLVENSSNLNDEWLKTSFRKFWSLWILNSVIIFWRNGRQIYTYSPFTTEFLRKLDPTTRNKRDLFFHHIPNLNGYPLRVALHPEEVKAVFNDQGEPFRGADVSFMNMVIKRLNASKVIVLPKDLKPGEIYLNGTGDGSIGLVVNNEADITFNSRFLVPYLFDGIVETSSVIARDDLCVLVPRSNRVSPLMNVFKPLKTKVWFMICSVLVGVFVLLKILVPYEENLLLWLYGWSLSITIPRYPNTNLFRIFLFFWLAYTLLITGAYRGNLTSFLVVPTVRPEINSLSELLKVNYKILLDEYYESHLIKHRNTSFHEKVSNIILPVSTEFFRSHILSNNISFGYMDKWHLQFYRMNNKKHLAKGRFIFHLVRSCPIPFHIVYVVPYGSPYLGTINRIIRYSTENGLLLYWSDNLAIQRKLFNKRLAKKTSLKKPRIVKLHHIQAAFFLLLGGWGIATVVFVIEKYFRKI